MWKEWFIITLREMEHWEQQRYEEDRLREDDQKSMISDPSALHRKALHVCFYYL